MGYLIVYDKNLKTFFGYFKGILDLMIWQKRNCINGDDIIICEVMDKHVYKKHLHGINRKKYEATEIIIEKNMNELTLTDDDSKQLNT